MMILRVGSQSPFQNSQTEIGIRLFESDLLQLGNKLFVRFDILGVSIYRGGAEQQQAPFIQLLLQN